MAEDLFDYDLLVIGSGPAGSRAAIQGAKLDKKVAIVERKAVLGGCSINLGTIPSKTLREAVLELSGLSLPGVLRCVLHSKAKHHDSGSAGIPVWIDARARIAHEKALILVPAMTIEKPQLSWNILATQRLSCCNH